MRQIKFKGKRKDNGVWVFGDYCSLPNSNIVFINANNEIDCEMIDPDTVSQFTGLTDKNGKEIYHKDRVNHENYGEGIIEWDDRFATFFVNFGIEDLELQMIILNECELLNERQ